MSSVFSFLKEARKHPGDPQSGSGQRGSALCPGQKQRWEAVFRRERRPESLDRSSIHDAQGAHES